MAKKTKSTPTLKELMSDPEQVKRMNEHLYSRKPLLEAGGHIAESLQQGETNKADGYNLQLATCNNCNLQLATSNLQLN